MDMEEGFGLELENTEAVDFFMRHNRRIRGSTCTVGRRARGCPTKAPDHELRFELVRQRIARELKHEQGTD